MKKKLALAAALLAVFTSCDYKQEMITKPVPLRIDVPMVTPTELTVHVKPDDDRVYYIYCISDESEKGLSPKVILQKRLDFLEEEYKNLKTSEWNNHAYQCKESDYYLFYAESYYAFVGLVPGANYTIYASCVDVTSDSPKLIGEIYSMPVKTMALEDISSSDMTIDFMLQDTPSAFRVYYRPLLKGKLCTDLYLCWLVESEEVIFSEFKTLDEYFEDRLNQAIYTKESYCFDICEKMYDYSMYDKYFEEGKKYIVWAVTYSKDALYHVYYLPFTYKREMRIDYTHQVYRCED